MMDAVEIRSAVNNPTAPRARVRKPPGAKLKTFALILTTVIVIAGCGRGNSNDVLIRKTSTMPQAAAQGTQRDLENTLYLMLRTGRVVIKLRPDLAPRHATRMKKLAREGFYNGLKFHRVIDGFMAQTGDPTGTGTGNSKYPDLRAEFSRVPFTRGIVGMARSTSNDSANSQFFIMFSEARQLNDKYTVVGEVIEGMPLVDRIKRGEPPANPDIIVSMQVAADAK